MFCLFALTLRPPLLPTLANPGPPPHHSHSQKPVLLLRFWGPRNCCNNYTNTTNSATEQNKSDPQDNRDLAVWAWQPVITKQRHFPVQRKDQIEG